MAHPVTPKSNTSLPTPKEKTVAAAPGPDDKQCEDVTAHWPQGREERIERGHVGDGERPAEPEGIGDPVEQRGQGRHEASERQLHPHVGAALERERRAQLRAQQPVGNEEGDSHEHQPGDGLSTFAGEFAGSSEIGGVKTEC